MMTGYLTIEEAAAQSGLKPNAIWQACHQNKLRSVRVPLNGPDGHQGDWNDWRVSRSDLAEWLTRGRNAVA